MKLHRLVLRSIWHYRRQHLAVAAGVAIATAVLTGALVVGDSVRYSLLRLVNTRLGSIREAAYSGKHYFRAALADEMTRHNGQPVVPALVTTGIAINSDQNRRIGHVQVAGIDERFLQLWQPDLRMPGGDSAIISSTVAEKLRLRVGDRLLLRLRETEKVPSSAPFAGIPGNGIPWAVTVGTIVPDNAGGQFNLKNSQVAPFNVFVPLSRLASRVGIRGYANLLAIPTGNRSSRVSENPDSLLHICWQAADAGLKIMPAGLIQEAEPGGQRIFQVTTDRIFFDDAIAAKILSAIPGSIPIITYLVNEISSGRHSTPYSFITAAGDSYFSDPPGTGEIIISDWLANDLAAGRGDSVTIRYYLMGPLRSLREDSIRLKIKAVMPLASSGFDPALMPEFPGMSSAGNCRDWENGAPINLKRIRDKDEQYWKDHRGTPKGFLSLTTGIACWNNQFGKYTSIRFRAKTSELKEIEQRIMRALQPVQAGISFRPVYLEGIQAASNGNDFGELFLSLSFFLIVSALLLIVMLQAYHARLRLPETGILSALGIEKRTIRMLLAVEASLVSLAGALAGVVIGLGFNLVLVTALNTVWQEAVPGSQLVVQIRMGTLATGFLTGWLTAAILFLLVIRNNLKTAPANAVKDRITRDRAEKRKQTSDLATLVFAYACLAFSSGIIAWNLISGSGGDQLWMLAAGGFLIPCGLAFLYHLLNPGRMIKPEIRFLPLIIRHLSLNRSRSLSAVALLALGIFTVIITGINRKTYESDGASNKNGTGGFMLWGESTLPISGNLGTMQGRKESGLPEDLPAGVLFLQLTRLEGDDASCLNLNQVSSPALAGVPAKLLDSLQAFTFTSLDAAADPDHPWRCLTSPLSPNVIAGIADQTVITWGLRKNIGDTLNYLDESGRPFKVKLMAGLDNSLFQGNLLIDEALLHRLYPSSGGSNLVLVKGPATYRDTITTILETAFSDQGLVMTPADVRLSAFNSVENTYLSVFMILGGMGVVLGTIGLGIVLLRNIRQRQPEYKIYQAIGFEKALILKMILAEHGAILGAGMFLGILASTPLLLPAITSASVPLPWLPMTTILLLILLNGMIWIWFPARKASGQVFISKITED